MHLLPLGRVALHLITVGGSSAPNSGVTELDRKIYVVLENASRILAVYRVRNDGMLKRLRRWPIELDTLCASDRAAGPEGRWVQGQDLQAQQMRVHWARESEFS